MTLEISNSQNLLTIPHLKMLLPTAFNLNTGAGGAGRSVSPATQEDQAILDQLG